MFEGVRPVPDHQVSVCHGRLRSDGGRVVLVWSVPVRDAHGSGVEGGAHRVRR